MDFNATIDLIIRDLEDARKIIDDLKKYPGVPLLQVELAKAKCKSAGEVISLLKEEEDKPKKTEDGSRSAAKIPLQREPETEVISQKLEDRSPKLEVPVREHESAILLLQNEKPDPVTVSPVLQAASPEPQANEVTKSSKSKKAPESHVIGDSFSHLSKKLNEQLGSRKTDDDLSDRMKNKPLTSLKEAIGINDRFLFIREIFDGNKEAYTQAITKLDSINSLTDAKAVIMSYKGDSEKNEAVDQLLDLVKRKLPSNE